MSATAVEPLPPTPSEGSGGWDVPLIGVVLFLMGFGLLMIMSASSVVAERLHHDSLHYVFQQCGGLGVGLVGATLVLYLPMPLIRRMLWPGFLVTLVLLTACLAFPPVNGASRWIMLGPVNFQPSELSKLVLILVLSHYLASNEGRLKDVVGVVLPGVALLIPLVVLMHLQKDLGTASILLGLAGVLFFLSGLQWRWLGLAFLLGAGIFAVFVLSDEYRWTRLTSTFGGPFADPEGSGFQVIQGWVAMANGGWGGSGLAGGLAQRGFLPEAHTDFIMAVVAEDLGLLGWSLVVVAFGFMVVRCVRIGARSNDLFGMLVCCGVASLLCAQAVVNLGVVAGIVPNTGLVLPFVSYGASAALVDTLAVGFVLKVALETREAPA